MSDFRNCGINNDLTLMPGQALPPGQGGISPNQIKWQNPPGTAPCVPEAANLTDILSWLTLDASKFICAGMGLNGTSCMILTGSADGYTLKTFADMWRDCGLDLTVTDSASIDLTEGTSDRGLKQITAVLKISGDAGNSVVLKPDGVYVGAPTCATIVTALEDGCIQPGTVANVIGFDAANKIVSSPFPEARVLDTPTVDMNIVSTPTSFTISSNVVRDPAANNILQLTPNGLLVPRVPLTVTDSSTVDLTEGSGPEGVTGLTATVKVSADPGNAITVKTDGLYVTIPPLTCDAVKTALQDGCIVVGPLTEPIGFDASGNLVKSSPIVVAVADTPTIDMTVTSTGTTYTVQGKVVIDPDPTNIIRETPAGIMANLTCAAVKAVLEAGCITAGTIASNLGFDATGKIVSMVPVVAVPNSLTVTDSTSIDLTQGTGGQNLTGLTAALKRDPDPANVLQIGPNGVGVFLPNPTTVSAVNGVSTVSSVILLGDDYQIRTDVALSTNAGNQVVFGTDGRLFVGPPTCAQIKTALSAAGCVPAGIPADFLGFDAGGALVKGGIPAQNPLTVTDSTSIDLTAGTGGQNLTGLTAVVKRDPDPTNILQITANGLLVPPPTCAQVKTALQGGCIPNGVGAKILNFDANGNLVQEAPKIITVSDTPTLDLTATTTATGTNISGAPIISPTADNTLTAVADGLYVPPLSCTDFIDLISPVDYANVGCIVSEPSCEDVTELLGHKDGNPRYFMGNPLYAFEVYPKVSANQTLSTTPGAISDITTLYQDPLALTENGLCPGEISWWNGANGRLTISRPGLYQVNWAIYVELTLGGSDGVPSGFNGAIYGAMRFVRTPGSYLDSTGATRTVANIATSLRGSQVPLTRRQSPAIFANYVLVGSHVFTVATTAELSLRTVVTVPNNQTIVSQFAKGDSGHFTVAQLPERHF